MHFVGCLLNAKLWIAFVLCTFGLIYSHRQRILWQFHVVNCFRSLYLWVDLQRAKFNLLASNGCELLSFFVPLGWFTAETSMEILVSKLWIAFVLCTFGLIYSLICACVKRTLVVNCFRSLYLWVDLQLYPNSSQRVTVVNCFRSLYLWVDLQQKGRKGFTSSRCELLSFFVPLGWFTASAMWDWTWRQLWIAFVLCTFGLIYS